MKFSQVLSSAIVLASAAMASPAPVVIADIFKRDDTQNVLTADAWTSSSSGTVVTVTPTAIDGVTISASPVTSSATVWNSLDSSGIPYLVTPTVDGSSTISASPTATDSDYPAFTGGAPPVLRCMNDRVPSDTTTGYPFCIANGTELVVGETYWITWDPLYFGTSVDKVQLQTQAYPVDDSGTALFTSDYISNINGYYPFYVKSSYKKSGTAGYFFLNMSPLITSTSDTENTGTVSGPLLRIVDSQGSISRVPSDNGIAKSSSSSSKNIKTIVPAVVVPVVVIAFVLAGVFYYFKNVRGQHQGSQKGFFNSVKLSNSGYFGSKSQRMTNTEAVAADDASITTNDLRSQYSANDAHHDAATVHTAETGSNPFRN